MSNLNSSDVPSWRVYNMSGSEVTSSATDMTSSGFAGQYHAVLDLDDLDGLGLTLAEDTSYIIKAYSTDAGVSNHAFYLLRVVPSGERDIDINQNISELYTDLHTPINAAGDLNTLIEESVWDSLKADHDVADSFGQIMLTVEQRDDLLNALSIDDGFTAGEDLSSIASTVVDNNAVLIGRWKIDPTTKVMTLYDLDNTTPLVSFDLKDSDGNPSTTNVHERFPQ
jgi:hypothetical protein